MTICIVLRILVPITAAGPPPKVSVNQTETEETSAMMPMPTSAAVLPTRVSVNQTEL